MNRLAPVAWALGALALAEAGTRAMPLAAGGLLPLALVLAVLALPGVPGWPHGGSAALAAARGAMLPLMAALPAMGVWCSAAGISPAAMVAVHAAAMLLPALLLQRPAATACRLLLLAGGLALLWPGVQGLFLAATLHAAAAGVACAGAPAGRSRTLPLALAGAVLLLGLALDRHGPAALQALHAALALAALLPARAAPPLRPAWGR